MKTLNKVFAVALLSVSLTAGVVHEVYAQRYRRPTHRPIFGWAIVDWGSASYDPDTGCWHHEYTERIYIFGIGLWTRDDEKDYCG